jgi:hypothetical protein
LISAHRPICCAVNCTLAANCIALPWRFATSPRQ